MLYALAHAVDFLLHAYIAAALAANGPQWMLVPALFLLFGGIVFVAALLHLQEAGFYAFLLMFFSYCAAMSYVLLAESPTGRGQNGDSQSGMKMETKGKSGTKRGH